MQTPPPDLTDDDVAAAASSGWRLPPTVASYLAVGYGSHHWRLEDGVGHRWFVSVDVLAPDEHGEEFERLSAALRVAALVRESGRPFVVAPLRTPDGAVLRLTGVRYALALYPFVTGRAGSFGDDLDPVDAAELTAMLDSLHAHPSAALPLDVESFRVPGRGLLEATAAQVPDGGAWPGPFGPRLRELLRRHLDDLEQALDRHDRLVATAGSQADRLVLTHGEPHPGNLLRTADGLLLVDWETALLAPPERDVWLVDARTGGRARDDYTAVSGRPLVPALLERYRLAWALADVANFVDTLRLAPEETEDTAWQWPALKGSLEGLAELC